MKSLFFGTFIFLFSFSALFGQSLSVLWEELTSEDFVKAVERSHGVAVVPLGVIEKHGQQLPLGTDVYTSREVSRRAAEKEYAIVFPYFFMGQIFEAKNHPGTIAYSSELLMRLLDETCREIARNGIKKIILVNGHGGNTAWLQYFAQVQLESPRDYAVYVITPSPSQDVQNQILGLRRTTIGGHADEVETSVMLAIRPDLVKLDRANAEPGVSQNRLQNVIPGGLYTGIWWYAQYPNHYAGDARDANARIGELSVEGSAQTLANMIRAVKADQTTINLQNDFFNDSGSPLETRAR